MTGKERILRALSRQVPDVVPIFEWFIDTSVGQVLTGSDDPMDVVDVLELDAFNVRPDYQRKFVDDRTFVDEWGIERKLTGDILPAVSRAAIADIRDHHHYQFPDPTAADRFVSLERAMRRFGDDKAIVLNLRDGFSDVRDLLGYEAALMSMLLEPQRFSELLERSVAYNLRLATVAQQRFGIQIIATTDDVANAQGMLIRPATYFELIGPRFREAIQGFKSLGCLCIKHCDGNVDAVVDFWIEAGIDCLDPIDPGCGYTMAAMKARYADKICLKGNIDCTGVLCDGTPAQVAEEVRQCILGGGAGGGLIVSSSNTIHRGVRPENVRAMISAVRRYGRYPLLGCC
jgi:uroporphyrinogen decarboxylase